MMKKISLLCVSLFFMMSAFSQEEGAIRGDLNFGYAQADEGPGASIDLGIRYNITDVMNAGLRLNIVGLNQGQEEIGGDETSTLSAINSYLLTYDYYFPFGSSLVPYVGAGAGLYSVRSSFLVEGEPDLEFFDLQTETGFGGMIRAGFELSKFRVNVGYEFVPESTLQTETGEFFPGDPKIDNNYLLISIGFFFGSDGWD